MSFATLSRTGAKLPRVGFGLWKIPNAVCADTVYNAIKVGYRLFDGAGDYGNEKEAGDGIKRAISEGLVKREDLWITSKAWNSFHAKKDCLATARYQLNLWGLEYFDLFLIHFPIALKNVDFSDRFPPGWHFDGVKEGVELQDTPIRETWEAMEELVDAGLTKNIGISNFSSGLINDLLRYARYKPQVLQVEIHPYLTQLALLKYCKTVGIHVTAYSSFGPTGWAEINMAQGVPVPFENPTIVEIAQKKQKSPAQIILRWSLQLGTSVIPKSNNSERQLENLSVEDFELTPEEVESINSLNRNIRFNDPADIDPRLTIFA